MYKPVKVMPYSYTNLDGRVIDTNENSIGVGEFRTEDSESYNLVCKIDKNVGNKDKQYAYAFLIAKLLNDSKGKYIIEG
jgi:hypothetical protein